MALKDWSTTAASNTSVGGVSIAEGMSPAGVNNAMRAMMADISAWTSGSLFNVKDYGAVGDGFEDDTEAIQAALNAGNFIFFPPGTYYVTSTISKVVSGASSGQPGVRLIGAGRRDTKIEYGGTSGYVFSLQGTAVDAAGNGLAEGIEISGMHITGTGKAGGNTDCGIYIQGFQFVDINNIIVEDFPQDGIRLDRLYYRLAPDPTLDDRAWGAKLARVMIRNCGRHGLWAGGSGSTDYCVDHLVTEQLFISGCGTTGAKIWAENWVDICSMFAGDAIALQLYTEYPSIPVQSINLIGSRFEGGESNCHLEMQQARTFRAIGCFFTGSAGPLPPTSCKIATKATAAVGIIEFTNCIWQTATTAIDIVGTGTMTHMTVRDPIFGTVTTEVANATDQSYNIIYGNRHVRGYNPPIRVESTGNSLDALRTGDSDPWLYLDSNTRRLMLGGGADTADVNLYRSAADRLQTDDQFKALNILLAEQESAPDAVANAAVIYAVDDGAGKTQLMVRFPTGASRQISIEP